MKTGPETQNRLEAQLKYSRKFSKPEITRNKKTPIGPAHLEKTTIDGVRVNLKSITMSAD
jgi:hypothetical protein